MKKTLIALTIFTSLFLSACQGQPKKQPPENVNPKSTQESAGEKSLFNDEEKNQMIMEFSVGLVKAKIKKNTPDLFCDQSFYTACYDLEPAQCIKEIGSVKDECISKADAKFSLITEKSDLEKYLGYIGACVAMKHMLLHSQEDVQKIVACLKAGTWDEQQRNRSLLK